MMKSIIRLSTVFILGLLYNYANAQLTIAKIYSDNMVIQRDQFVKVWGWTNTGEKVSVDFMNKTYDAISNAEGKWQVTLPKMSAGGPHNMTIASNAETIKLHNILIGDVWLCSGQSNMEWPLAYAMNAEEEIANAKDSNIRHFKVPLTYANDPENELAGGSWLSCSPDTAGTFSAVGYFFARAIREHHDVPIGLLNSSWGGSRIEPWMRREVLSKNGEHPAKAMVEQAKKKAEEKRIKLEKIVGPLSGDDKGMVDGNPIWASSILDDSEWTTHNLPGLWEGQGLDGFDGMVWYRKAITLSKQDLLKDIKVGVGRIDDSDVTFVNGNKVGGLEQQYNTARVYDVNSLYLKEGENVIAVRVEDTGGGGGIHGEAGELFIQIGNEKRSLTGLWKQRASAVHQSAGFAPNQTPTYLYNKMIHPIIDFPIKGALWYQGESNANEAGAYVYRDLFKTMITDWRKLWGVGDFPFLYVQLANFMAADDQPAESNWAVLRESQSEALSLKNVGEAVIIDIGEAEDIHPTNKQDVGLRLALAGRKIAYGENPVYSGPSYMRHTRSGQKVILSMEHVGGGLMAADKYGYLKGFALSGTDGKYHWAQAIIKNNKIEVWHPEIANPTALRYGWGNNPDDANLYNKEGLPASPFRIEKL